jgi:hypothetical protein
MIKRYENSLEYGKSELDILTYRVFCDVHQFVSRRLDRHSPYIDHLGDVGRNLSQELRVALDLINQEISTDDARIDTLAVTTMMRAHWQFMNRARPKSRLTVFWFYWTGLGLLTMVSVSSIYQIISNGLRLLVG